MNSLVAAELLKIRKRWMPYVLLLTMVAGAAFFIWLIGYVSYKDNPADEFSGEALRTFAFPWSIASLLDSGQFWGAALFVAVLTSSTVATEYGWGTVRQTLIRGQARSQYLVAKLIGIALVCVAFLLVALAIALVFSLLATTAAGKPITLDVLDGPSVPEIGVMIARSAAGILPYGLLAFALSVGGRSTALGVSGTIGYMFVENILGAVLNELGGVAADIRSLLLGHNVSSLIAANRIGSGDYVSMAPRDAALPGDLPDVWLATLIIAAYCAFFLVVAFAVFNRRDIPQRA